MSQVRDEFAHDEATEATAAQRALVPDGDLRVPPIPHDDAEADDVVWLSAEELEAWLGLSGILIKLPSMLDGQLERDSGLRFFEYLVLAMLSEQDPPQARMSRLAVLTGGSLSRLSHVAKRLENQGYLVRSTDPDDRRSTLAHLTDEGMAKVKATAPGHVASVRDLIIDTLSPAQIGHLTDITRTILARIDPEGHTRPIGR